MEPKNLANRDDCRLPGKVYDLTEAQKAQLIQMSVSFLQKDRLRKHPRIDFARYGTSVRYSRT